MYFPTFHITELVTPDNAEWLRFNQNDSLELIDITDICASFQVGATLRDANGFLKGSVDPNGDYKLI